MGPSEVKNPSKYTYSSEGVSGFLVSGGGQVAVYWITQVLGCIYSLWMRFRSEGIDFESRVITSDNVNNNNVSRLVAVYTLLAGVCAPCGDEEEGGGRSESKLLGKTTK